MHWSEDLKLMSWGPKITMIYSRKHQFFSIRGFVMREKQITSNLEHLHKFITNIVISLIAPIHPTQILRAAHKVEPS